MVNDCVLDGAISQISTRIRRQQQNSRPGLFQICGRRNAFVRLSFHGQDRAHDLAPPTLASRPAFSNWLPAAEMVAKGNAERSAISRSECAPSEKLSVHITASSAAALLVPPTWWYSPRRPNCGSHFGFKFK